MESLRGRAGTCGGRTGPLTGTGRLPVRTHALLASSLGVRASRATAGTTLASMTLLLPRPWMGPTGKVTVATLRLTWPVIARRVEWLVLWEFPSLGGTGQGTQRCHSRTPQVTPSPALSPRPHQALVPT